MASMAETMLVCIPIFLIWLFSYLVYATAARRDARAPIDDVGVILVLALVLYTTLPPLVWLFYYGGTYDRGSNSRLIALQPNVSDNVTILWIGFCYIGAIYATYALFRKHLPEPGQSKIAQVGEREMLIALSLVVIQILISEALIITGLIPKAESYIDEYRVIEQLPIIVRQLNKIILGLSSVAKLILLVGIIQRSRQRPSWIFIYIIASFLTLNIEGSRLAFVTGLLGIIVAWHVLIRPIRSSTLLTLGVIWFLLFTLLGIRRDLGSWSEVGHVVNEGLTLGELDSLWANTVLLAQQREAGLLAFPAIVYWSELLSFIPSQLLPFTKINAEDWFIETYDPLYKEAGGGWAFGAISQAIVGGGMLEAVVRGTALGIISLLLVRWHRTPSGSSWRLPIYLYILINSYRAIRVTTFAVVVDLIQFALPVIVIMHLCRSKDNSRNAG
jgi:hypothetical protein